MGLARGLSTISSKKRRVKITKAKMQELELQWRQHNRDMKRKGMHDLRYDTLQQYIDYAYGRTKIQTKFQPLETTTDWRHSLADHRERYPSAPLTKPTTAVDNSWKAEQSKNFTVAPAYNKGAYQVIPRSDVKHIGK
tara:strand:+ start:223 stop:633 length:411 start_codon:yes stop_codon:yes gene_type:complete